MHTAVSDQRRAYSCFRSETCILLFQIRDVYTAISDQIRAYSCFRSEMYTLLFQIRGVRAAVSDQRRADSVSGQKRACSYV